MTMSYCRTCGRDVHITHDADECDGEPDLRVPDALREERALARRDRSPDQRRRL
jgi:hypothetical protein